MVGLRKWAAFVACSVLLTVPSLVIAKSINLGRIGCAPNADQASRQSSEALLSLLSGSAAEWNPKNDYSIAGTGALGRLFMAEGRAIHPKELAASILRSPNFVGKKRKSVWLGVSDSEWGDEGSFASRLSAMLDVKVSGCIADAYLGPKGLMMCGSRPVFGFPSSANPGRAMPMGFALGDGGILMLFCQQSGTGISPQDMLSSSVAFGLYDDEIARLEGQATTNSDAAFRLYQYHWISRRDAPTAMRWLELAAKQGHSIARYNLAYELFESGALESKVRAEAIIAGLTSEGFAGPDLRAFYS